MANDIAPEGPAADSGQETTVPGIIQGAIPSAIDVAAEQDRSPHDPLPVAEPVDNTNLHVEELATDPTDSEVAELKEQLKMYQEDHQTLQLIRNDPQASQLLNDHFTQKTRGSGVQEATGDANADSPLNAKVDKLFGLVEGLIQQSQTNSAETALIHFANKNPIVRDSRVAGKMQEILRQPGANGLGLDDVLTLALSQLKMSRNAGGPAPLQTTESGGAHVSKDTSESESEIQKAIDGQETFESGLNLALRQTAREQEFI
tara:strand:+ start:647 stop:1426 length:780 start_codon:yes stop_codon:yes gene_type:complete